MRKYKNIKRYTRMNSTKGAHELTEGKLERHIGEPRRIGLWTVY